MHITVVTPEHPYLKQDCQSVTLPGVLGEMQILPGHAPIMAELKAGTVAVFDQQKEFSFTIEHGYVEVKSDEVNVLCEGAKSLG